MAFGIESGLLLAHTHALADGERVRLRLARDRDREGIRRLLERHGRDAGELAVRALTRFDPRRRFVVCVTRLIAGREMIAGVGAIGLGEEAVGGPQLLVVDPELGGELREALRRALVGSAVTSARLRAA